jgi:hypothetical protein
MSVRLWKSLEDEIMLKSIQRLLQVSLSVVSFFILMTINVATCAAQQAQEEEAQSRQIVADEFLDARPAPKSGRRRPRSNANASAKATGGSRNRSGKPANAVSALNRLGKLQLGVTLWRLRPAVANDEKGTRLLVQDDESEWTLERVGLETKFIEGQKVRLSIESPLTGYLYIIDRERYADGTYSEPYLIFPTQHPRRVDNSVTAGKVIEIPDQEDNPPYFRMRRGRADQTGEVLTVIVTPQPIPDLVLDRKPIKLSPEQFAQWEKKWGLPVTRFEYSETLGKTYTLAEKQAGSSGSRLLEQDDPLPQTIFRVAAKTGDTLLITVPLLYETAKAQK